MFFAFIGFDAVSTTAEETRNPQRDMPIGIIASLIICTVLYVLMAAVLTGIKKYTIYAGDSAAVATAFAGKPWAQALVSAGALAGTYISAARVSAWAAAHFHGDGPRRFVAAIFRQDSSAVSHTARHHHLDGSCCWRRRDGDEYRLAGRPD